MRVASILGVLLILALNGAAAAPAAAPFRPYLSDATLALALLVLIALLLQARRKPPPPKPQVEAARPAPPPQAARADAEVTAFLAMLQEKGRLVDFLMDDINAYPDAQVGAAARVVHAGCKSVLAEHFSIHPLRTEPEGSTVEVPAGYAADEYRLVGKIAGQAPFSGVLVHRGWKTDMVKLPQLLPGAAGHGAGLARPGRHSIGMPPSMTPRFSLGIDLGTSNCALAVADNDGDRTEVLPVTQIVAASQVGELRTLPSALYLPHPQEFPDGAFPLPWEAAEPGIVGQFARDHGALVPDRLVTSAKSWLSNPHIDPKQRTLPWRSDIAEEKLSPFDCSRRYLHHLKESFLHTMQAQGSDWTLAEGQVVLTVPASFDEVARSLTAEAAEAAGLGKVVLLEEPQAAFYAWTAQAGRQWRNAVAPGDIILVCDVGGGTADFSLIAVTDVAGELELERISVGEHILLGGDNMDLALAYTLQAKLEADGKSLDSWQFLALVHAAARAKIALFEDAALAEAPIAVPSRGSSLFAKMVSTALDRGTLSQVVLDGFFARTAIDDLPQETRRGGLREFGLPYASDPVVSKHLARFLTRSLQNVKASDKLAALAGDRAGGQALMPTAVLFNGGVFKAAPIRERVLDLLASWNGGEAVRELEGFQPDLAVAQGAAVYGRHRATGKGMRIKAGAARSYYVGLESSMPAVPGFRPPVKALCVVPQGMEEGTDLLIEGRDFGLVTGHTAEFRFFSSEVRSGDTPGQIVPDAERQLEESSLLEVELPSLPDMPAGQAVPVRVEAVVTELGTLELWMKHTNSDRRWKIEFQVRTE